MLFREVTLVYSENHKKHTHTLQKNAEFFNAKADFTKTNRFTLNGYLYVA
jgi:hypothetical protein